MLKQVKINGTQLKLIAIIAMLIDHIGAAILEQNTDLFSRYETQYDWMRIIGRLAFPIFCYLSVQGFFYTKDIKKYLFRLFVFAILSEVPFDLAFFDSFFYLGYNNVMWSLLLGIIMLAVIKKYEHNPAAVILTVFTACTLGVYLRLDYLFIGPLLMWAMYKFRSNKRLQMLVGMFLVLVVQFRFDMTHAIATMCSFVFLWFYDGSKGRGMKYFFYFFYPVHLLILYIIRKVMFGG